jgi:hypothetical protein
MLSTQFVPAGIVSPQVLVTPKALGLTPLSGVVNTKFVFPMFCKNATWGLLVVPAVCRPNATKVGKMGASVAVAFRPVPNSSTACVAGSLSVTVNCPNAKPTTVGEKIMLIVQLAPGVSPPVARQVFAEIEKGAVTVGLMFVRVAVVETFLSVATIAPPLVFITVPGYESAEGVRLAICGVPVPLAATLAGLFVNVPKISTIALRAPTPVGVNSNGTLQVVPGFSGIPKLHTVAVIWPP